MSSGAASSSPIIVSAFQSALLRQAVVVLVVLVLLAVAWSVLRSMQLRLASGRALVIPAGSSAALAAGPGPAQALSRAEPLVEPEPVARRFLRIAFGLLWVFDGILQGQTSMPLGMTSKVIGPTAAVSPEWVRHLVSFGTRIWSDHPIAASTAVVWIQLGLGLWLLVAPRGRWSRAAGLASLVWGLVVWVFGEVLGGLFAPGASWLFGAPGAVLFYCVAGALIALDERHWATKRIGRRILRLVGVYLLAMAVLQAWPGRGFWQGEVAAKGSSGALASMLSSMARTPQPHVVSSWVSAFAAFTAAHGFAVNLVVVVALGALGVVFLAGGLGAVRWAVIASGVVCLADWVLVQDFGFFGGTGTDPNSMIPMLLVIVAGYLAYTRPVAAAEVLSPELELPANLEPDLGWVADPPPPDLRPSWRDRVRARPVYAFRVLASIGALAVVLLGAAPMAAASLNGRADPIVSQALNGSPTALRGAAPDFVLTGQDGRPVSLHDLRGKVVVLTFLDPVSMEASPIVAQELREASSLLAGESGRVEFVAVVENPRYRSRTVVRAFDQAQGLAALADWLFLTGSERRLSRVWAAYGVRPLVGSAGLAVSATDRVFVIDAGGNERWRIDTATAGATAASESSLAQVISESVQQVLGRP